MAPNLFDLTGQRVLVSGAAGAIGSAAARALAAQGAELALVDIRPVDGIAEELRGSGANISTYQCDNSDRGSIARLAGEVGPVDALAECSGAYSAGDWVNDESWDELLGRLIDANLRGPLNLVRAFIPLMADRGGGRIAILGSIAGRTGGTSSDTEPAYVATKGAIHSLIRYLARYAAQFNIVVNGLAPGPVMTPMVAASGLKFDMSKFPLGRLAEPAEIGWPVAFLCSAAAWHMSGTILDINGGTSFS